VCNVQSCAAKEARKLSALRPNTKVERTSPADKTDHSVMPGYDALCLARMDTGGVLDAKFLEVRVTDLATDLVKLSALRTNTNTKAERTNPAEMPRARLVNHSATPGYDALRRITGTSDWF